MKENIQKLIASGKTEEALEILRTATNDALLLQAQFNNGKKQYQLGLIEYGEWQRIVSRVSFAALEMAEGVEQWPVTQPAEKPSSPDNPVVAPPHPATGKTVFISYSQKDSHSMRLVQSELGRHAIKVRVDKQDLGPGHNIQDFIQKAIDETDFILTLISENSLMSSWVGFEIVQALNQPHYQAKWIPVRLDNAIFQSQFYFLAQHSIQEQTEVTRQNMMKALEKKLDPSPFNDDLKRLTALQNNLGTIIEALKKVNVIDLSGDFFDLNMPKLVQAIVSPN